MRITTDATRNAWESGGFVGGAKASQRATIQKLSVLLQPYRLENVTHSPRQGAGDFSSIPFGQPAVPLELPNLKSIKWDRSVEQDVASCTIEMYNVRPLPPGTAAPNNEDFDQPGFYTFNRGASADAASRWGYTPNSWSDVIVPDRLIRTFEGYGANYSVPPEEDVNMYPSGLWLIDDVELSPFGVLTLSCRDVGRALLDLIHLPPVVPLNQYPVSWTRWEIHNNPDVVDRGDEADWIRPKWDYDSNQDYIGTGITDGGAPYVSSTGGVNGHDGRDAFDSGSPNASYFLSVGNRQKWSSAYEYVQGKFSSRAVSAVRVKAWAGPYTMYISVYAGGEWKGKKKIPYRSRVIDTHADIPFVKAVTIKSEEDLTVKLPKSYTGATKVRITMSNLYDSGIGINYRYRAGIRDVEVLARDNPSMVSGGTRIEGDYNDYSDIVKFLCAWGGWYWPREVEHAYTTTTDGAQHALMGVRDPVLPRGGLWGNFENTTKNGPSTLTVDLFDKKPLMDGINYVREIVGFNFYIDECGGVVWRSPNIWSVGNNVYPVHGGPITDSRTTDLLYIDEEQTLMDLRAKVSSRNVREKIFVSNATNEAGAVAAGFNPYPSGLRRVGGWTDQHFGNDENGAMTHDDATRECQIMADLITVRQLFTYRTNQIQIPGNPAIQIDDQVRIYERVTGETFIHYVKAISSNWDAQSGQWTYDLETHWLGETPFTAWSFDPNQLHADTILFLEATGKL